MKVLVTLGLCAPLMFAQTKPPAEQVAGDCAVNISGNNNSASLEL